MNRTAKRPNKEAAAAVAAVGAAAVGGKLAWDRLSARRNHAPSRAYRLEDGEFVPDGIRRVARGQLDDAREQLADSSKRELEDAVHESRKGLKRLRASLRLTRPAIGEVTYRSENAAFRDAGRRLAGARDARVLVETLDALSERFGDELSVGSTAPLRKRLERQHEEAVESLRQDGRVVGAVVGELESARQRTASWTFDRDGFDALAPGLRRIYRRGRRRMGAAAAEPSIERLHEWRKRVKDLWHASQLLRPAAPKRMRRLARRAHRLSDLLGEDHDLAVLREYVEQNPDCFESEASRAALVAVIDRRRRALQRQALDLGQRIYRRSPKRFVRSIERRWRKRAGGRPQPVAG